MLYWPQRVSTGNHGEEPTGGQVTSPAVSEILRMSSEKRAQSNSADHKVKRRMDEG